MNIPDKTPIVSERDAVVLKQLIEITGNPEASKKLLDSLPDRAKDANYAAVRDTALEQALRDDPSIIGKKVKVERLGMTPGGLQLTGHVDPAGLATITALSGGGMVSVIVPMTIQVHADDLEGLLTSQPLPTVPVVSD